MTQPLAVTVSSSTAPARVAEAREKAAQWGVPYFERPKNTGLTRFFGAEADAFLVLGGDGWRLTDARSSLGFSPNLAMLRIKRIDAGERDDVLLKLAELAEGEQVLDCTLGLGADALVCARAVGPKGRVVGLEKSLPLALLMGEGLARWRWPGSASVEVLHADAGDFLARAAPGSFDVVLFDPMFERERRSSPAFELLRRHAIDEPLTPETLAQARRVARRWVLVKAARYSAALPRLGLKPEPPPRSAQVVWARVPAA